MKTKLVFTFLFIFISLVVTKAQSRGTTLLQAGGGWTSVAIEGVSARTNGYLINLGYEKFSTDNVSVGGSVHYLYANSNYTSVLTNGKATLWSVPIYFDAKYYLGQGKLKPFLKGSMGYQFSGRKLESNSGVVVTTTDSGITVGLGAGVLIPLNEKMSLNLDYQWYWINNYYYSESSINSISLNLVIKIGE